MSAKQLLELRGQVAELERKQLELEVNQKLLLVALTEGPGGAALACRLQDIAEDHRKRAERAERAATREPPRAA